MSTVGPPRLRRDWLREGMSRKLILILESCLRPPLLFHVRWLTAMACELELALCHFDIEQAFVQSDLKKNVFMRLPQGCGRLSGKMVRLTKSLYGLKQGSGQWHAHLTRCLQALGFLQRLADACVFRLMEEGSAVMTIVVHVDDKFAVGENERCDQFGRDVNQMVPVKNLGELR